MIIILFLCLCLATKNYQVDGWMQNLSKNDDLDLERQLKIINKPPIKTIQTEFGSIVDCIDINKQLAFDNPLLKNHKIQLKPSFQDTLTKANSANFSNNGMMKNLCPKGTVPVQRTTKEDLLRTNNINGTLTLGSPGTHFAELRIKFPDRVFFGLQGTISVYNPPVGNGQKSSTYIWVSNIRNDIQTGWQVNPELYGDTKSHFFASWSNNLKHTGCTNLLCPGFVQVSRRIYLGTPLNEMSIYDGSQVFMGLSLQQDAATNNWWLIAHGNMQVGYFPEAIFSNNLKYATEGGWTGSTFTKNVRFSPPMGCGHFPDKINHPNSCYIFNILFKDENREDFGPLRRSVATYTDNPRCYDVEYFDYVNDELRRALMLGGPGGDCGI